MRQALTERTLKDSWIMTKRSGEHPADYDRVGDALRDFYRGSLRQVDRIMTASGASAARARILKMVLAAGTMRSIDLAASFGFAPRTVTEAIDGLERDGLVRRTPDAQDRRAKWITLTPAGRDMAEVTEVARRAFLDDLFGVLSVEECDEIVRVMGKLNMRLAEMGQ
jgi:DNA-binding MarR family transcriptional regulator